MNRLKSRDGFTVMEVMIALVILTIGLLGLVTTAALVTRMIGRGHRATSAALYGQQKMEEIRARLGAIRGCAVVADGSDAVGPASAYRRTWRIITVTNAVTDERQVFLGVTYPSGPETYRTDLTTTIVSCQP